MAGKWAARKMSYGDILAQGPPTDFRSY